MGEFEYELDDQPVIITVTDYEPYEYRGWDEPPQEEHIEFLVLDDDEILADERTVSKKAFKAILARFKELNDLP